MQLRTYLKDSTKMKINVTIDVSREVLENIFVTALEGGSNYWCKFSDEAVDIVNKTIPRTECSAFSERVFKAIYDGEATIPIHDAEDGELIGELSKDTFQERLETCANQALWALQEEIDERGDAASSDVVFQYLTMGEFVYG